MFNKYKKIISYYSSQKALLFLVLFMALMEAAVSLLIPYKTKSILENLDNFNRYHVIILSQIVILIAFRFFCSFFVKNYGHVLGAKIEQKMKSDIFEHYMQLPMNFYNKYSKGDLLSRITLDLYRACEFLHHAPIETTISSIKLFGTFFILFSINKKLTCFLIVLISIFSLYFFILKKKLKCAFMENHDYMGKFNSQIEDTLQGIKIVKAFNNELEEKRKFEKLNENFSNSKKKIFKFMGLLCGGSTAILNVMSPIIIILSLIFSCTMSELITFILYLDAFSDAINRLVSLSELFEDSLAGFHRFFEIFLEKPEYKSNIFLAPKNNLISGEISFNNILFKYKNSKDFTLKNFNLTVEPSELVTILGKSGIGKSTIFYLLTRFYDVNSG